MTELSHKAFHKLLDRRFHYALFQVEDLVAETFPKPIRKEKLESAFQNLSCNVLAVAKRLPSAMFLTTQWNRQCLAAFSGEKCFYRYWSSSGISVKLNFYALYPFNSYEERKQRGKVVRYKTRRSINFFDISSFYEASSWILCSTLKGELLDQKLNFWVYPVKKKRKRKIWQNRNPPFFKTLVTKKKKAWTDLDQLQVCLNLMHLKSNFQHFFTYKCK